MHCINQNCFDDKCDGECLKEDNASQKHDNKKEQPRQNFTDQELIYCED